MMIQSVLLQLAPVAAFKLFTNEISLWWPADRRHTKDPDSALFLAASGRFYERARDGSEIELGRVREWEEPRRILLDFYIATGPDHPTEAEITFVAEGAGSRVTVIHRAKPGSAHLWDERAPRYAKSWELVFAALATAAQNRA